MSSSSSMRIEPRHRTMEGEMRLNCLGCGADTWYQKTVTKWDKQKGRHVPAFLVCILCGRSVPAIAQRAKEEDLEPHGGY